MNGNAMGLIETLGLVGLIYAVDAMLKATSVELASPVIKLDGGIVSVMVQGDVSSVRAAVEAMKRFRKGRTVGDLSIRKMIDQGRSF